MNQITLLEFCQVPENRIKLMEEIIKGLEYKYFICNIINSSIINKFKRANKINETKHCTGRLINNPFGVNENHIRLDQILPELLKYKHEDNIYQEVWFFYKTIEDTGKQIRIEALNKRIKKKRDGNK